MKIIETGLKFGSLTTRKSTKRVIVHHSAGSTGSAAVFHRQHQAQGWSSIGYHFVILPTGVVERGRPENTVGAHAQGSNSDSLGVVLVGNFEATKPTPAQINSLAWLLKEHIFKKYGELPVVGHRDVMATACPGKNFPWDELRRRLKVTETKVKYAGGELKAVIIDGVTYAEVRKLAEALGKRVDYDAKTKLVEIK